MLAYVFDQVAVTLELPPAGVTHEHGHVQVAGNVPPESQPASESFAAETTDVGAFPCVKPQVLHQGVLPHKFSTLWTGD
ncbi:zinc finger protein 121 [Biomphalaria glabrata]